jgi:hypothetical protein
VEAFVTYLIDTNALTMRARLVEQIRLSARLIKCRWPRPDDDGRCRYCGWPLIRVERYDQTAGTVAPHWRHRRPLVHARSAQSSPYRQWQVGAGGRLTAFTHESWVKWQAQAEQWALDNKQANRQ